MKRFFIGLGFAQVGFALIISAFFSACVDINLKSELPKVDYYELDDIKADAQNCGAYTIIALEGIEIPQSFAGRNIFYKEGNRIRNLDGIRLNDNLKSSLESMIIKNFANHCIKAITPPFSGIKLEQFLRIKLLNFNANRGADSSAESSVDSAEDSNAVVSFAYQIYQNGNILQSGIITEYSAISDFNGEGIFNALQDSTKKAIRTLTDKIIPK